MKKVLTIALMCLMMFGLSIPAYAEERTNIDESIAPYQVVIDKVNVELGSAMYIPEKNKEMFYNNIKNTPLDEFEAKLRSDYKDYVNADWDPIPAEADMDRSMINVQSGPTPYSDTADIEQTYPISYNSEMLLESRIFSVTGASGTYTYQRILGYGTQWPTGFTGYHWHMDSGSYSLSSNNKNCTVTLKGHPQTEEGIALPVILTESHTFTTSTI